MFHEPSFNAVFFFYLFFLQFTFGEKSRDSCSASLKGCDISDSDNERLYKDMWGYTIDIYDPADGWTEEKRHYFWDNEELTSMQTRAIPRLTEEGFKVMKMPEDLHQFIKNKTMKNKPTVEAGAQNLPLPNWFSLDDNGKLYPKNNTLLFNPRNQKKFDKKLIKVLKPILEEWSGIRLKHSVTFGVRRYLEGSRVLLHVDKYDTHVISAILQIDQKSEKKWPLYYVNHQGESKILFIEPGDMVLYESAKLPHGRMQPFQGDFYDNMFVHFRPAKRWYAPNEKPRQTFTKEDLL